MTLRQSDPRWGHVALGKSTLSRVGCLVTCLCESAQTFGTDAIVTPDVLVSRGVTAKAFVGASAILDKLATCAGLAAPRDRRVYGAGTADAPLRAAIMLAFSKHEHAILHVNHDADPEGDHFVLGLKLDPITGEIVYADPALGSLGRMNLFSLSCPAQWAGKTYKVVDVAPVYPLAKNGSAA